MMLFLALTILLIDVVVSSNITVSWVGGSNCQLAFLGQTYQCALGKNGATPASEKQEGDGKTPFGSYPLRRAFYRADKLPPSTSTCYGVSPFLQCEATQPDFGWVDAATDPLYNQFVTLPYNASHENLYLTDSSVYDLLAVIGYNDDPVVASKGSAIFFHVASAGYGPTAGCISMALGDLTSVLSNVHRNTWMNIVDGREKV